MSTPSNSLTPLIPPPAHDPAKPFRSQIESAREYATVTLDPSGVLASWNAGAERLTGYTADEAIGQHLSLLYPADEASAAVALALLQRTPAEGSCEAEIQCVRKEGTSFQAQLTVTALVDQGNNHLGYAAVLREISENRPEQRSRQHAEVLVQTSEARYRTIFDHAQVGIVLADAESYYIDANASACRMLGYSREEFIGLHATDIVIETEARHIGTALNEISEQSHHRREWRFRRKDGSVFSADVIATQMPDGTLLGMISDVSDRKRAEDYRAHLAAIVESSQDAIAGMDLNGTITSWNAGAEEVFGYTASEMIGNSSVRLIPVDRLAEEEVILESIRRGERVEQFETLRQARDQRLIEVLVRVSPIRDAGGRLIGASKIARDITTLKAREREISWMSRLFAALSQINQAIVWMSSREELFQKVCQVLVEQGGFRLAWIGRHDPATERIVPVSQYGDEDGYLQRIRVYADERPEGQGPTGTAFRLGRPYISNNMLDDPATLPWRPELIGRGFLASGAFPIREGGVVSGTLTVYSDTQACFHEREIALLDEAAGDISFALDNLGRDEVRRKTEKQLHDEKQFNDTMIEAMPGVVYFYTPDGQFLRWNRNFETVSGYSGAEIARMRPRDFFSEQDRPRLESRIAEVFSRGESTLEALFMTKSGTSIPYFFTGRRVQFGEMSYLVGVGIDISERRQIEAERGKRHRAEAADHIKSAFLATMSHELRTPLNSIIGFTGILLQGLAGPLNPEQQKQLSMVQTSARHLLALINDVLDISKIEAGQLQVHRAPFDIRRSITKVQTLITPQVEAKGLELGVQVAPELGEAVSDERRFEQILLNLLSNALKFTDHGRIVLSAALIEYVNVPGAASQPAICLRVSDTGIGIKPEELASLFQPFRQIDSGLSRKHEGTGLGLAICRRLATLMGGEIHAESEWSKGSTFSVTLPLKAPPLQ